MDFDIIGEISEIEVIAHIRVSPGGDIHLAELHWYEAHGVGKKEFKGKRYLR